MLKNIAATILAITPHRPFPRFARDQAKVVSQSKGETIIFLSDPFARYVEPQVEQAAFDVLSACGYDVHVLPVIGAGASMLSKGFLDAAKRHAGKVLEALNQIDPTREAAIVGIEPPEIYTLKHDYLDLIPAHAEEIASRAARTWLLDEYLLRSEKFRALAKSVQIKQNKRNVKFQPHCHHRAEGLAVDGLPSGASATVELLRICGYKVELIESGCCGMAGTFGYEAEHYDLSIKVGELKLFPFLRSVKDQDSVVVGTGAACRMQMNQGAGVDVIHPINLVADLLKSATLTK